MDALRTLVCFKVTPDFEAVRASEWAAASVDGGGSARGGPASLGADTWDRDSCAEGGAGDHTEQPARAAGPGDGGPGGHPTARVDTRFAPRVLNCFDESALELALRLRDAAAGGSGVVELGALSIGGREVERYLETLYALGYERAARVDPGVDLDFSPGVVASIIAAYVRDVVASDVVMLGCRAGPGDSGIVPFLVAETLGWPCVAGLVDLEPLPDGRLRAACLADDGHLRLTVRPPCVLAVGNAVVSRLRVPTLSDRLACRERRIRVLSPEDVGIDPADEMEREGRTLTGLETIDRSRPSVVVEGATAREKARTLFESHLRERLERL